MKYGSVCSGIEAATCAWHPLGWEPQFFSEVDKAASSVLARKYPHVPNHGDMTKFQEWPDHAIDLLVGGTPCQSFSVAGLRKGMADPRGNLVLTFLAIADRYRPEWVVWENVPGVLSSNGGRDFGAFLGGLGELGYGFAYRVLDAQYVRVESHPWAVPQRRRRVFVVGHLGDWRRAAAVLFERESLSGHSPPRREAGKGASRGFETGPGGGGWPADVAPTMGTGWGDRQPGSQMQDMVAQKGGMFVSAIIDPPEVSAALKAWDYKGQSSDGNNDGQPILAVAHGTPIIPVVAGTMKAMQDSGGFSNSADHAAGGYMIPIAFDSKGTQVQHSEGAAPTLRSMSHDGSHQNGGGQLAVTYPINTQIALRHEALGEGTGMGIGSPEDPAFTLQAGHSHAVAHPMTLAIRGRGDSHNLEYREDGTANAVLTPNGGRGGIGVGAIAHGWAVRRLTPLECCRLQGFPDDYLDFPGKPLADGPKYKMLGNSMAVNVMRWIGQRINEAAK